MTMLMDEEWCVLARLLPDGWQDLARETGAMQRNRGEIKSADLLLQVLLLHVATGLSLKQAATRAQFQGLVTISDVALLKRLRSAEGWLCELARRMFTESRFALSSALAPEGRRLRAVDATTVEEPGATGTDWRVHYSIGLPGLNCDFYELTDLHAGETYKRVPVSPGDIILGDRGYCHREGVAYVLQKGADVIVRLNSSSFPLVAYDSDEPFPLGQNLRQLEACQPGEWPVRFKSKGHDWKARLCAIRKSRETAEKAKKKILQDARKKGRKVMPDTLEFAEYIFVLTTLNHGISGTSDVLEIYRARWQIELCFKRLKSLLQLGHLPKRSTESARAWIQGKLLTVLLIERVIEEAQFFSPWGFPLFQEQSLA